MDTPLSPILSFVDDSIAWTPDQRLRAVATILARGLLRTLDPPAASTFSAGRMSENPSNSSDSELALTPEKSVTVPTG